MLDGRSARHRRAGTSNAAASSTAHCVAGQSPLVAGALGVDPLDAAQVLDSKNAADGALGASGRAGDGEAPVSARHSIMIVDDDDAIREALEDVLSDEGYQVVGMADGQQALDYLRSEKRPSAILVDLWMPVMDGWKFLDALLEDPRFSRIPLVVLTAARDQRARDLRVSEVLTKPVQLQQVLGTLERLTKVS
jgi:CheY-like chemotaxis protein